MEWMRKGEAHTQTNLDTNKMQSPKEVESMMFEPGKVTKDMINKCIRRCRTIQLHETMEINGIKLKAYYAGHVLGAVMFYIEYNGIS